MCSNVYDDVTNFEVYTTKIYRYRIETFFLKIKKLFIKVYNVAKNSFLAQITFDCKIPYSFLMLKVADPHLSSSVISTYSYLQTTNPISFTTERKRLKKKQLDKT